PRQARKARGATAVCEAPPDFATRLVDGLAQVLDDAPREILETLFHQVAKSEEVPRPVQRGRLPPGIPRPKRLLDRDVDVFIRRQRNPCDDAAGCRIGVLEPLRRLRSAPGSADVILQIPVVGLD